MEKNLKNNFGNKPSLYIVIPAEVRFDKELSPSAKLLYGEISELCFCSIKCRVSNDYFAKLYSVNSKTIQKWIDQLEKRGYIAVDYELKDGKKGIIQRYISVS